MQKIHWKYITLLLCRAKCTFSRCIGLCSSSIIRIQSNFANSIINPVKIINSITQRNIGRYYVGIRWGPHRPRKREACSQFFCDTSGMYIFHWIDGTIIFLSFYDYCLENVSYCVVGEPIGLLPSGHQLPLWSQQREAVEHLQAVAQDLSYQKPSRLNLINRGAISLSILIHNNIEQDLRCLLFAQLPYKKSDGDEELFCKYA